MMYLGDFPLGQQIPFWFNSHKFSDASMITLAGSPVLSVYKQGSTTETTTGPSLSVDYDSRPGMHYVTIDTTDAFYVAGCDYAVVLTTGTVDGVGQVGEVLAQFSIRNRTPSIRRATAQAGAAGTITLDSSASAVDDFYNKTLIFVVGGTGIGQSRLIIDYTGSSKIANISPNWITNPDNTSVFVILPAGYVDVGYLAGAAQTARDVGASVLVGDKTGFALATTPPTAAEIRTEVDANSKLANVTYGLAALKTLLDTVTGYVDTEVAAIKAKTDNLPANPAAIGDIPSAVTIAGQTRTELATELARIDAAISTRLASAGYTAPANSDISVIKAKTDNLPASPAAVGSAMTLTSAYDAAKTAAAAADIAFVVDRLGGKTKIVGNQQICYKADNVTEICRFDLKDANGNATMTSVYEKSRVIP